MAKKKTTVRVDPDPVEYSHDHHPHGTCECCGAIDIQGEAFCFTCRRLGKTAPEGPMKQRSLFNG